jgi:hypothetical protein
MGMGYSFAASAFSLSPLAGEGGARDAKRRGKMRGNAGRSIAPEAASPYSPEAPVKSLILPLCGLLLLPQGKKGL